MWDTQAGPVFGAIERSGRSGRQATGGAEDEGETNDFFPNLAPRLFNFFNKRFFFPIWLPDYLISLTNDFFPNLAPRLFNFFNKRFFSQSGSQII
jgi:hypothetical protein